jgi:hypothetical protein
MLSKINQAQKDKYWMISLICGICQRELIEVEMEECWLPGLGGRGGVG